MALGTYRSRKEARTAIFFLEFLRQNSRARHSAICAFSRNTQKARSSSWVSGFDDEGFPNSSPDDVFEYLQDEPAVEPATETASSRTRDNETRRTRNSHEWAGKPNEQRLPPAHLSNMIMPWLLYIRRRKRHEFKPSAAARHATTVVNDAIGREDRTLSLKICNGNGFHSFGHQHTVAVPRSEPQLFLFSLFVGNRSTGDQSRGLSLTTCRTTHIAQR